MGVLTGDVNVSTKGPVTYDKFPCSGADTFYQGAIVWVDLTSGGGTVGQAQVASLAAGDKVVGICTKQQTTTAAGQLIEVLTAGQVIFPLGSGVTLADIKDLLVHDDSDAYTDNYADMKAHGDVTLAANDMSIGVIMNADANGMTILIGEWTGRLYDATLHWL